MTVKCLDWPIYFKERLWLVNPDNGYLGVATLWTPKEKIAPLMTSKVAVVGQLYTSAGIEYLIRNLWANPKISCLVVCGQDRTESGTALINFFKKKLIFDYDFMPKKDLEIIRQKVHLVDLRRESDLPKLVQKINQVPFYSPFARKPKLFPEAKIDQVFPSETSVFRVESQTIGEAWLQILKIITRFGWEIPRIYVSGGREKMVLNLSVVISEENINRPKIYPFFDFNQKQMKAYFKEFFNINRGEQSYTYGERIFNYLKIDQLAIMAQKLASFPYNKGALAVLWQPTVDNFPIRQPWRTPCLTLIQGICLEEKLHLTAYFRSNDMFGAWPLNAFALRKLQTILATKINKKVGLLTTISQSAFIDGYDLVKAKKIIQNNDRLFCQWDPRGNLAIRIENKKIIVSHFSPEGKLLQEFKQDGKISKAALKMAEQLLKAQVISRVDHALDIGQQLARAEEAIKLGLKFEQDKQLTGG